jgi:trans-aconitate methyltransferase
MQRVVVRQSWDPELYAKNARFVSDLGSPVLELLAPRAGERILDLGCGDGVLSRQLMDLDCRVVGIDASPAQIEAARRLGVDARVVDGEALAFEGEFDAVFSNAALHWMKRATTVLDGVFRALVPGGRFVAEFGGEGCVKAIRSALVEALGRRGIDGTSLDPWYFPSPVEYAALLSASGFRVELITSFPRPTPLPTGIKGWLETFGASYLSALPPASLPSFIDEVSELLAPTASEANEANEANEASHTSETTCTWTADYVRLRFRAEKPIGPIVP